LYGELRVRATEAKSVSARRLRRTSAETRLWSLLRYRQIGQASFRRQRVLFGYIAGLSCRERDSERDAILAEWGIVTLRFANDQVTSDTQYVLSRIWEAVHRPPPG
jgi:very-short-patch-repair endonuclease